MLLRTMDPIMNFVEVTDMVVIKGKKVDATLLDKRFSHIVGKNDHIVDV